MCAKELKMSHSSKAARSTHSPPADRKRGTFCSGRTPGLSGQLETIIRGQPIHFTTKWIKHHKGQANDPYVIGVPSLHLVAYAHALHLPAALQQRGEKQGAGDNMAKSALQNVQGILSPSVTKQLFGRR